MYNDLLRFVVMKDPNWDYRTLDVSRQLALARKADNGVLSATSTDLTPFVSPVRQAAHLPRLERSEHSAS